MTNGDTNFNSFKIRKIMLGLFEYLNFKSNPFENYVAEKEPEIIEYLVRPRYLEAARARAFSCSSFILFGARGSGKSATRISLYKEIWAAKKNNEKSPLVINLIDFSRISVKGIRDISKGLFVSEIVFQALQSILLWLSAIEEDEREVYLSALNASEEKLIISMLMQYYLSIQEPVRSFTATQMMDLLNQAWHSKSLLWVQKRWTGICEVISATASAFIKKQTDTEVDLQNATSQIFSKSEIACSDLSSIEQLTKIVEVARIFGFSGITILVDKLDETELTNNSAENTAALIYPILSNVQLLEIEGLGWQFYLWDKVKYYLTAGERKIRLDKIPNAEITWDISFLSQLINTRLVYFSDSKISNFNQICSQSQNVDSLLNRSIRLSMLSPRELIRLLDTIVREHDLIKVNHEGLLNEDSINYGMNTYAKQTVESIYETHIINQIIKLQKNPFINADVQATFRTNANTARNRINSWISLGVVKHIGTRPAAEGGLGKHSYEYIIVDERIARMIEEKLYNPDQIGYDPITSDDETD